MVEQKLSTDSKNNNIIEEMYKLDYLKTNISRLTPTMQKRCIEFIKSIEFNPINIKMVQSLAFYGIPDELRGLR